MNGAVPCPMLQQRRHVTRKRMLTTSDAFAVSVQASFARTGETPAQELNAIHQQRVAAHALQAQLVHATAALLSVHCSSNKPCGDSSSWFASAGCCCSMVVRAHLQQCCTLLYRRRMLPERAVVCSAGGETSSRRGWTRWLCPTTRSCTAAAGALVCSWHITNMCGPHPPGGIGRQCSAWL